MTARASVPLALAVLALAACSDAATPGADALEPYEAPDVGTASSSSSDVAAVAEEDVWVAPPEPDIVAASPEVDVPPEIEATVDVEVAAEVEVEVAPDVAAEVEAEVAQDVGPEVEVAVAFDVVPDVGPPPETFDPAAIPEVDDAFPFAVQAADATPDGALLWTRVDAVVEGLHVVVWDAEGVLLADLPAVPGDGGFVEVEVVGLLPWTDHWYAFVADEPAGGGGPIRSAVGRFRTAPHPDDQPALVFGATSCNNAGFLAATPLAHVPDAELDLFLMAGDTVYADGSSTVGDYRAVWEESYLNAGMKAAHASTSFLYTWDDHEVDNNWNPETLNPSVIASATQVYFEHAPTRRPDDAPDRLWRSFLWGRTAEFFVLDTRGERKPSTKDTAGAEYMSPEQLAWLQAGLMASEATFKVILHGVAFTDMPWQYPAASDRWEGYDAQRAQLLDTLEEVDGVLFVAGDFHFASIGTIEPPGNLLDYIPEVLAGPVAQFGNPGMLLLSLDPQFSYLTMTNNYTRFVADPMADPPAITVELVAGDGDVFHTQTLYF